MRRDYGCGEGTQWVRRRVVEPRPRTLRARCAFRGGGRRGAARSSRAPHHGARTHRIVTEPAPVPASTDSAPAEPARQPWSGLHRRTGAPCSPIPNRRANDDKGCVPPHGSLRRRTCYLRLGDRATSPVLASAIVERISGLAMARLVDGLRLARCLRRKGSADGTAGAVGSPTGAATSSAPWRRAPRIYFIGLPTTARTL